LNNLYHITAQQLQAIADALDLAIYFSSGELPANDQVQQLADQLTVATAEIAMLQVRNQYL